MLMTSHSFQYEIPQNRRNYFNLSDLLRRKTLPSPQQIMNNKMTKFKTSKSKTLQISHPVKNSKKQPSSRQKLKINYQILRTKSSIRINSFSQKKINKKLQQINHHERKNTEIIKINQALQHQKIKFNQRNIPQKKIRTKSLKQSTEPIEQNKHIENFQSLKMTNNSQIIFLGQSQDLKSKQQFLKKGSSVERHILSNLVGNKILQQNFSPQKFLILQSEVSNLTKLYKGSKSSINYTQIFAHPQTINLRQSCQSKSSFLKNVSRQRIITFHNFESKKQEKHKGFEGWQISSENDISLLKSVQKYDPITDSSWNQVSKQKTVQINNKKKKEFNSRKKLHQNILKC